MINFLETFVIMLFATIFALLIVAIAALPPILLTIHFDNGLWLLSALITLPFSMAIVECL